LANGLRDPVLSGGMYGLDPASWSAGQGAAARRLRLLRDEMEFGPASMA
jgi:hypothetical protein